MKIPIIVCGAFGRMGREVITMAQVRKNFDLKAAIVRADDDRQVVSSWPFPLYHQLEGALHEHGAAVVIDFSSAALADHHITVTTRFGAPLLLATTGYDDDILEKARNAAKKIPIAIAPNTSLMANLMIAFCALASARLGQFEASILDIHHTQKKDAPSGTAHSMAQAIKNARPDQEVEVCSMRKGTVAGEHTAYFFNEFDRLEITHRVVDRKIFAEGALVAAQFLFERRPGLYDMNDVLNLNLTIKK